MGVRTWLESWPVYRQLTGDDPLGRGAAAQSPRSKALEPRTATADRVAQSVCPYCAVGCAQRVYVKDEKVVQIEGNPDSPISRGRLCPKGSASLRLVTGPQREKKVRTGRRTPRSGPSSTCTRPWRWWPTGCSTPASAAGRSTTPNGGAAPPHHGPRQPRRRDAGQRGELPHQEAVHRAGRHPDREPGPYLTLRHRSRSGNQLRSRRRHGLPAGPRQLRLHRDHGLEHGRGPSGRVPVGDGGQGARRAGDPHRPAVHPHQRGGRHLRADPRRQ